MRILRKSPLVLSVAAVGFLVGSVVVGSFGVATAGPTVKRSVTANQGTPGSSPWLVSGNVGLAGSLPTGSNTIGNVGVTGSLPAGTNNIGHVNVNNFPATQAISAGGTVISTGSQTIVAGGTGGMSGLADTSAVKEIRVTAGVTCSPSCPAVSWELEGDIGGTTFFVANGTLGTVGTINNVYQVPALAIQLYLTNNSSGPATVSWAIGGWAT